MKYEEIQPQEQPEIIDEVRMGPNALDQFINSKDAAGIVAGFEAEMYFTGKGDSSGNMLPDMYESVNNIDDICRFFQDGGALRDKLKSKYSEWRYEKMSEAWEVVDYQTVKDYIEQNDFDFDDEVMTYLTDELGLSDEQVDAAMNGGGVYAKATSTRQQRELKDSDEAYAHYAEASDHANQMLDDKAKESIRIQDYDYERAREEWEQEVRDDDDWDQGEWLKDQGVSDMTDVIRILEVSVDINRPRRKRDTGGKEFNVNGARKLARTLSVVMRANVEISTGHGTLERKEGEWIIESDPSLDKAEPGDMPAEIVSPPLPLGECLATMEKIFQWARSEDAYTNSTTGLHVGVSLPHIEGTVDYVKLALFLGDHYVLEKFNRAAAPFCASALNKIKKDVKGNTDLSIKAIDQIRQNLIELAAKTLRQTSGHGKYTSINPKVGPTGSYIEFRSMGNDYLHIAGARGAETPERRAARLKGKLPMILDTIKRYSYAMYIAKQPDLHREEYAKKLYKLLSAAGATEDFLKIYIDLATSRDSPDPGPKRIHDLRQTMTDRIAGRQRERDRKSALAAADDQLLRDLQPDASTVQDTSEGRYRWKILMGDEQVFIIRADTQGEANDKARFWLTQRSPEFNAAHAGKEPSVVPIT